jgi:hypothetical protein
VGFYDAPGGSIGVTVVRSIANVAAGHTGVRAVDVSHPSHPVELAVYDTPGAVNAVAVVPLGTSPGWARSPTEPWSPTATAGC